MELALHRVDTLPNAGMPLFGSFTNDNPVRLKWESWRWRKNRNGKDMHSSHYRMKRAARITNSGDDDERIVSWHLGSRQQRKNNNSSQDDTSDAGLVQFSLVRYETQPPPQQPDNNKNQKEETDSEAKKKVTNSPDHIPTSVDIAHSQHTRMTVGETSSCGR